MRDELAPYLHNMESVKMRVRIKKYLHYKMDGVSNLTTLDPLTKCIVPMFFANPSHLADLEKIKFGNSAVQTLVKPLSINGTKISNIDHMIVWCDLGLPPKTECDICGYISAYVRGDGTTDYCICN